MTCCFAFLHTKPFLKKRSPLKGNTLPGRIFFPFRVDSFSEERKISLDRVASPISPLTYTFIFVFVSGWNYCSVIVVKLMFTVNIFGFGGDYEQHIHPNDVYQKLRIQPWNFRRFTTIASWPYTCKKKKKKKKKEKKNKQNKTKQKTNKQKNNNKKKTNQKKKKKKKTFKRLLLWNRWEDWCQITYEASMRQDLSSLRKCWESV